MDKEFSKRIRTKYEVQPDGCWLWKGATKWGYGILGVKIDGRYKHSKAHRLMYSHVHGPIPPWLVVAHKCMNKGCINPEHLELVTTADNAHYPDKAKLTSSQISEIRASTKTAREIAKDHGIYFGHVYKIKRGEVWA